MLENQKNVPESVIACNPKAIDSENRDAHSALVREVFSPESVLEVKELANGYGFRLPVDLAIMHRVITFIANERLCCPFFTFSLVIGEQFWLELTGAPDVKAFIGTTFVPAVRA